MRFENLANRASRRVDFVKDHVDAVPRQVLGEFLSRMLAVDNEAEIDLSQNSPGSLRVTQSTPRAAGSPDRSVCCAVDPPQ